MKLLRSWQRSLERKLQSCQGRSQHTFGRRRSDCDTSCTPSAIEKNLRYQTTDAVSDDYRRRFEPTNDLLVMIDNFRQSKSCEPAWITPKLLDLAVHAGPVGGDHAVTFFRVMFDPVLPTERRRPKAGDKNNRGDVHRENAPERASFSPGKSSGGRKLNAARLLMSSGLCLSLDSLTTDRKIRRNF